MPAPQLDPDLSLFDLRTELVYTRAACAQDAFAKPFATRFAALLDKWTEVLQEQLTLQDAVVESVMRTQSVDATLDQMVDDVYVLLLSKAELNRSEARYSLYFSSTRTALKRPVLGQQLVEMKRWMSLLPNETDAKLRAIGRSLPEVVTRADEIVVQRQAAETALAEFRLTGALAVFRAKVVAARDTLFVDLEALRVQHKLPADYSSMFFRPTRSKVSAERKAEMAARKEERRAKKVERAAQLSAARAELTAAQKKLAALKKK